MTSQTESHSRVAIAGVMIGAFIVSVALAFASSGHDTDSGDHLHHQHYGVLAEVPIKDQNRPNPLENDPDAKLAGRKLFARYCASCHGENAEGTHRAPNLRASEVLAASPGTLFWVMTNGVVRSGMPVWSRLPEPQRWQITSYLKTLGPAQSSEATPGSDRP